MPNFLRFGEKNKSRKKIKNEEETKQMLNPSSSSAQVDTPKKLFCFHFKDDYCVCFDTQKLNSFFSLNLLWKKSIYKKKNFSISFFLLASRIQKYRRFKAPLSLNRKKSLRKTRIFSRKSLFLGLKKPTRFNQMSIIPIQLRSPRDELSKNIFWVQ